MQAAPQAPWRLSRHAWQRVCHGKRARFRRPYAVSPGGTLRQHPSGVALPARIVCPACGLEQMLDLEPLRLTPLPLTILPAERER